MPTSESLPLYNYICRPLKVVDGDTIDVMVDLGFTRFTEERIRLYDIDTPESFGRFAEPRGKLATIYVELWLRGEEWLTPEIVDTADGPHVYAMRTIDYLTGLYLDSRSYVRRDGFRRALADLYRPGDPVSLNVALAVAGHQKLAAA